MGLFYKTGDLLKEQVDAIINTVNCVGVMGKGIALQFKQKWPSNYKEYVSACKKNDVKTGKMFIHDLGELAGKPHYIINFPTKDHWRGKSKIEYIQQGLDDLVDVINKLNIKSIAIPPLGCGNGGLAWSTVKGFIELKLGAISDVDFYIYEPKGAPIASSMVIKTEKPAMTIGRAILIKLISAYGKLGYLLSKIEIQKLCYFAQESGEPLKLNFMKNQFGPYANNLRHVLDRINGHYITGVGDHDTSEAMISLKDNAISDADEFLKPNTESLKRLNKVTKLIEGFQTPYGMELLATVHWVATKDIKSNNSDEIINGVYNWNPEKPEWNNRKKQVMEINDIQYAITRLKEHGWL